jgi:hypothetical protein
MQEASVHLDGLKMWSVEWMKTMALSGKTQRLSTDRHAIANDRDGATDDECNNECGEDWEQDTPPSSTNEDRAAA